MAYTSIQIGHKTRIRLAKLRTFNRETYDEVLNKLIDSRPLGDEEGEYTSEFVEGLMKARKEIREGKTYSNEEVKKRLGL